MNSRGYRARVIAVAARGATCALIIGPSVASSVACSARSDASGATDKPVALTHEDVICQVAGGNGGQGCGGTRGGSSGSQPPTCGVTGGPCCGDGACQEGFATCVNNTCVVCGTAGQMACPGGTCFDGTYAAGTCIGCDQTTVADLSATATSTQATVRFTSSADFSSIVWLVNAADMSDQEQAWSTAGTSNTATVTGLRPASTYEIVMLPGGSNCAAGPTTVTMGFAFTAGSAALARNQVDFDDSTVTFNNGNVVFTPSDTLARAMPDLASPPPSVTLPSKTISPGGIFPDYTATFTAFAIDPDLSAVQLQFNTNDLEMIVPFKATLHLHTSSAVFPDADLHIDSGSSVDIHFAWSPTTNRFFLERVTSNIANHVSDCGLFSFCNGIFESQPPDLDSLFSNAIGGIVGDKLSLPSVTAAVDAIFSQMVNGVDPAPTPWSLAPGAIGYAGQFVYTVQRVGNASGSVKTAPF